MVFVLHRPVDTTAILQSVLMPFRCCPRNHPGVPGTRALFAPSSPPVAWNITRADYAQGAESRVQLPAVETKDTRGPRRGELFLCFVIVVAVVDASRRSSFFCFFENFITRRGNNDLSNFKQRSDFDGNFGDNLRRKPCRGCAWRICHGRQRWREICGEKSEGFSEVFEQGGWPGSMEQIKARKEDVKFATRQLVFVFCMWGIPAEIRVIIEALKEFFYPRVQFRTVP